MELLQERVEVGLDVLLESHPAVLLAGLGAGTASCLLASMTSSGNTCSAAGSCGGLGSVGGTLLGDGGRTATVEIATVRRHAFDAHAELFLEGSDLLPELGTKNGWFVVLDDELIEPIQALEHALQFFERNLLVVLLGKVSVHLVELLRDERGVVSDEPLLEGLELGLDTLKRCVNSSGRGPGLVVGEVDAVAHHRSAGAGQRGEKMGQKSMTGGLIGRPNLLHALVDEAAKCSHQMAELHVDITGVASLARYELRMRTARLEVSTRSSSGLLVDDFLVPETLEEALEEAGGLRSSSSESVHVELLFPSSTPRAAARPTAAAASLISVYRGVRRRLAAMSI